MTVLAGFPTGVCFFLAAVDTPASNEAPKKRKPLAFSLATGGLSPRELPLEQCQTDYHWPFSRWVYYLVRV